MSNKHINTQHCLTTMNSTRPKSLLRKRVNKAKANERKVVLLTALQEAKAAKLPPKKVVEKKAPAKKAAKKATSKKSE
jgi:hypothetical protein